MNEPNEQGDQHVGLAQARSAQSTGVKIRYIGAKPKKFDTVAGTNIEWDGFGDVQEVPAEAAAKLLIPRYGQIWNRATDPVPVDVSPAGKAQKTSELAKRAIVARDENLARKTPAAQLTAYDVEPMERICSAIGDLAEKGGEGFTEHGPTLAAVQKELGKKISPAALREAWDYLIQQTSKR